MTGEMGQQIKVLATNSDDLLSSILGTHILEGENQLSHTAL